MYQTLELPVCWVEDVVGYSHQSARPRCSFALAKLQNKSRNGGTVIPATFLRASTGAAIVMSAAHAEMDQVGTGQAVQPRQIDEGQHAEQRHRHRGSDHHRRLPHQFLRPRGG